MKIKLYRSSTVGIDINGYKILMDPWLTDGEYFGSWSHYPYYNLQKNLDEINSYDVIYISHIHPDHCSDNTLRMLDKKIPVYIHNYHTKFLKMKLERLGFKVIELKNGKRHQLSKHAYLNIFAADNCNPELCFKFSGCADLSAKNGSQQIDTLSVIDDGKKVLLNVNDCPFELAQSTFKDIKKQYKKIDLLFTGYGGAGPYPQCFENLNLDEKKAAAKFKENQFLKQAIKFINEFKPNYYLPFAGTYTLTGRLSDLQDLRGVPTIDFAYSYFEKYFNDQKTSDYIKPLKLNLDSVYDLDLDEYSSVYKKINLQEHKSYIETTLKNKKLTYEVEEMPKFEEIYELSKKAFIKFLDKKLVNKVNLKSDIFIKVNGKSIKLGMDNKMKVVQTNDINLLSSKYVLYETDIRLLKKLLLGPKYAHWNNAEIGSHVKFFRKPNVYERDVYASMCYLHI